MERLDSVSGCGGRGGDVVGARCVGILTQGRFSV